MKRRPPFFWPIAVVFAVGVLFWAFHIPYAPQKLYRAIPAQASFLSAHRDLAGRWNSVGTSPLIETVFTSMGMKQAEIKNLNSNLQFRDWLNRLLSDEFVLAQVPHISAGKPAWVLASWLGGKSQVLRLALQLSNIPDVKFSGVRRGWPIWIATSSTSRNGERLSFSLVEGMLVATYASGDDALNAVLSCVDGTYPSLEGRPESHVPDNPPDRGWFRVAGSARAHFEITTFASNRLAGFVHLPGHHLKNAAAISSTAASAFAQIQTDLPAAVAIVPPVLADIWAMPDKPTPLTESIATLMHEQADGPMVVSLFAGDYRGTFLKMRVPGIVISATSTNTQKLGTQAGDVLQQLNISKPWKLEMEDFQSLESRGWSVVSRASNTLYGMSKPGDQFGVMAGSNWAGIVSCVSAFTKIGNDAILRANRPLRLNTAAESAARRKAAAYMWVNLDESAPALRTATGSWVMRLKTENTRSSQALRTQINDAMHWFYGLQPLGTLELFASPGANGTRIEFETTPLRH